MVHLIIDSCTSEPASVPSAPAAAAPATPPVTAPIMAPATAPVTPPITAPVVGTVVAPVAAPAVTARSEKSASPEKPLLKDLAAKAAKKEVVETEEGGADKSLDKASSPSPPPTLPSPAQVEAAPEEVAAVYYWRCYSGCGCTCMGFWLASISDCMFPWCSWEFSLITPWSV